MWRIAIILLISLLFEAAGILLLSKGLKQLGSPTSYQIRELLSFVGRGVSTPSIVLGVAFEAVFFAGLLYLLSQKNVSLIWPLTSLSFLVTAVAARILLKEEISTLRWCGILLICAGAGLVSLSERQQDQGRDEVKADSPGSTDLPIMSGSDVP